jgi:hypothetical protein
MLEPKNSEFDPEKWLAGRDYPMGSELDGLDRSCLRALANHVARSRGVEQSNGTLTIGGIDWDYIRYLQDMRV